jgi:hypothetical protein
MQNVVPFPLPARSVQDERTQMLDALRAARELPVALAVLQLAEPGSSISQMAEEHVDAVMALIRAAIDRAEGR